MCSPEAMAEVEWNLREERGDVFVSSQISIEVDAVAKMGS
jgi:hypothetical protein